MPRNHDHERITLELLLAHEQQRLRQYCFRDLGVHPLYDAEAERWVSE